MPDNRIPKGGLCRPIKRLLSMWQERKIALNGSWRVRYFDCGAMSNWISYGNARQLQRQYGGKLEWFGDL